MRTSNALAAALVAAVVLVAPRVASAQFGVIDRIRKEAADKANAKKKQADSAMVARASRTVDSTLEKTGRGVDTAVAKVGTATDTVLNRGERGVKSLASGARRPDDDARLAADLADDGRVALEGLRFTTDGALDTSSRGVVRALAKLIRQGSGAFLVEGHVAAEDPARDQTRSETRAKAVKSALVEEGVDASRLFVMAFGSSRAPASGHPADRIEVARMQ
ncbi:MAG: OmpA family protein [Gemmatimonadaceae bacterium]|nr:OmpA family protein [Gemmatimonadaceae bacterium]NUQ94849.1 OmpA family protein [Gemmatimonadaceae bacterium]NUR17905.1 OmpA family protein [Gemmatimonadaceae bacterium]NUS98689.1 OmpA family protein [Gemmatimonadaceae bacterium]